MPLLRLGWLLAISKRVLSSIASTKPSPRVLSTARSVRTVSVEGTCSCACGHVERSFTRDRPEIVLAPPLIVIVGLTKFPFASRWPTRSSVIWPGPPLTGFWWHSEQEAAFLTGGSPGAGAVVLSLCSSLRDM